MATAQASSPLRSDQVLYPMSSLGFPPVSELVLHVGSGLTPVGFAFTMGLAALIEAHEHAGDLKEW